MNTSTVHIFVPCTEKHYPSTNRHEAESVTLSSLTPAAIWTLVKATDTSMMQTTVLMEVASLAFPHPAASVTAFSGSERQPGRPEQPVPQGDTAPLLPGVSHVSWLLCKHTAILSSTQKERGTYEQGQCIICQGGRHPGRHPG